MISNRKYFFWLRNHGSFQAKRIHLHILSQFLPSNQTTEIKTCQLADCLWSVSFQSIASFIHFQCHKSRKAQINNIEMKTGLLHIAAEILDCTWYTKTRTHSTESQSTWHSQQSLQLISWLRLTIWSFSDSKAGKICGIYLYGLWVRERVGNFSGCRQSDSGVMHY